MVGYTDEIRELAGRLLKEGEVDVFIGYMRGTVAMMNRPVVISNSEDADVLYWDSNCGLNLCNYLTKRADRVGIVATGCNSRNIVTHITENQIERDRVYIVGIACTGMIDRRAVERAVKHREITDFEESDGGFTVRGGDFEEEFDKEDFLQGNCLVCERRSPVEYDEMIGESEGGRSVGESYKDIEEVEGKDSEGKWGFFTDMISRCIRCYACRNACPLCYCPTCFVDESGPQWVGKSIDPVDTMTFHILRAYHCAGRCTDCGACERACPLGISVRQFTRKLNKDVRDLFSWEAGLSVDQRPPLDVYRPDDYDGFVR